MPERLQRALARAGLGSRRSSEELIREGRVTVNGRVATLGDKVETAKDVVRVDGSRVPLSPDLVYLAFHKPAGVVTTARDPQGRIDLRSYLPEGTRVFSVGRLDRESEGLLLLTNEATCPTGSAIPGTRWRRSTWSSCPARHRNGCWRGWCEASASMTAWPGPGPCAWPGGPEDGRRFGS